MEGATSKQGNGSEERDPTELDQPDSDEHLYETFGSEEDDPLRPVFQGDVFTGLTLRGYDGDDHDAVMLVGHPCSLRKGADLRDTLQAVAVHDHQHVPPRKWRTAEKQYFPLPALDAGKHKRAELLEIGVVTRDRVQAASRVATLSDRGVLLLQQRMVWTLARTVVRLDTFAEFNAPQLIERELLEYWNEQLCEECSPDELVASLKDVAQQFEEYMLEGDRRKLLDQPDRRAEVRRGVRAEAERRRTESNS
jgi:hypothetical protein